jgi:hypothetical protein
LSTTQVSSSVHLIVRPFRNPSDAERRRVDRHRLEVIDRRKARQVEQLTSFEGEAGAGVASSPQPPMRGGSMVARAQEPRKLPMSRDVGASPWHAPNRSGYGIDPTNPWF